jgi:hypothetical protein
MVIIEAVATGVRGGSCCGVIDVTGGASGGEGLVADGGTC